ncbi:MAG: opioid growth factor receptor [Gemmataceae bacterium]|nr:opioid growth factor receptor [Gemmataceae bacterium]
MAGSPVVEFYAGRQPDYLGRTLDQILGWDDEELENRHNFIQILFPTFERSGVTPRAPTLTTEDVEAFHQDDALRANLARAFDRMLSFYGLVRDPQSGEIGRGPNFGERSANWVSPHNHNYLRITRILKCLSALGLADRAAAFLHELETIYRELGEAIGPDTLRFWRAAVS